MMNQLLQNILQNLHTGWRILLFLAVGVGLYFLFSWIRILIPIIVKDTKWRTNLLRYLPLIQAIAWLLYAFALSIFIITLDPTPSKIIGLGLIAFLVISSWNYLRDYISGLFLKVGQRFRIGQRLRIEGKEGLIHSLNIFSAEIELSAGEFMVYPFSKLAQAIIIRQDPSEKIKSQAFLIQLPEEISASDAINQMQRSILKMPWALVKQPAQLVPVTNEDGTRAISVVLYAVHTAYFSLMHSRLEKEFETN